MAVPGTEAECISNDCPLVGKVKDLEFGHEILKQAIDDNTALTEKIHSDTAELLNVFNNIKVGVNVIGVGIRGLKWLGSFGLAVATIWYVIEALKHGGLQPHP